jgi:hypothetical protein
VEETLGRSHYGRSPAEPVAHTPFEPDTVVDPLSMVSAGATPPSSSLRPDLHPDDLIVAAPRPTDPARHIDHASDG